MNSWTLLRLSLLSILLGAPALAAPSSRFEVIAWIDHFDYAAHCDTETLEGLEQLLNEVQQTGATSIWWRTHAGGRVRYPSAVEDYHHSSVIDKRITFDNRHPYGWVRYGETEFDTIKAALAMCKKRVLRAGVHWPFEESHFEIWSIGGFNAENPQYWCRSREGLLRMANCSLSYEAVVQHKLAQLDEILDRGAEEIFLDFMRISGFSHSFEYVEPMVESFKKRHAVDSPPGHADPRWRKHVFGVITEYLRRFRKHLDARDRKITLVAGIPLVSGKARDTSMGFDWLRWIDEGLIDALNVITVNWDKKNSLPDTRAQYEQIIQLVDGRCPVYFPVRQYNHYATLGLPAYERSTGKSQPELAGILMRMAHEVGGDGVALECVDDNNYAPEMRKILKELAEGHCKLKKQP